ncbi:CBS domain-containing protein [Candidatus Cloacimonadota bacterium]
MNRQLKDICSSKKVQTIGPEGTIRDAVEILNEYRIGCLVVLNANDKIEGIISERDILQTLGKTDVKDNINQIMVKEIMTPKEKLITASSEATLEQLMHVMRDNNIRHIPILDENENLTCITSIRDVVRLLLKDSTEKLNQLNDYITGKYPA